MKKTYVIILLLVLLIAAFAAPCLSSWLIYHKPAFKGKVVDAETKEPIEGAVVVVVYNKHTLISGPAGGHTSVVEVKEVLTDKDGEFFFPSYITIIQPNSIEHYARFIIYKPGYGSLRDRISPPVGISLPTKEKFFLEENFGKEGEVLASVGPQRDSLKKVIFGLVELPRLRTWKARWKTNMIYMSDIPKTEWPLLSKMIEEEDEWLRNNKGWRR